MKPLIRLFLLVLMGSGIVGYGAWGQPVRIDLIKGLETKGSIRLSEIAQELRYVKLETTKDCLINRVNRLYSYRGEWFLRQGSILRFDKDGRFLNTISGPGKGPAEYIELAGIGFNTKNDHLFMIDGPTGKAMEFSLDGKFVGWVKNKGIKTLLVNDDFFANYFSVRGLGFSKGYRVTIVSLDGKIRQKLLKQDPSEFRNDINMQEARFYVYKDSVTCWENISDTVYRIGPDLKVIPRYFLDFGKEATPLYFKVPISSPDYTKEFTKYTQVFNFIETEKYLFFNMWRKGVPSAVVYRKSDGYCFSIDMNEGIMNDLDPDCYFWPMGVTDDGQLYMIGQVTDLKESLNQKNTSGAIRKQGSAYRQIVENSLIDDNPILIVVKLK